MFRSVRLFGAIVADSSTTDVYIYVSSLQTTFIQTKICPKIKFFLRITYHYMNKPEQTLCKQRHEVNPGTK